MSFLYQKGGQFNIKDSQGENQQSNKTPGSKKGSRKASYDNILNQAGKNIIDDCQDKRCIDIDPRIANQVLNNFQREGGIADQYAHIQNANFLKPNKNPILAPSKNNKKPPTKCGQDDILMAQRLANVEKQFNQQQQMIKQRDEEIIELKNELQIAQKAGSNVEYTKEIKKMNAEVEKYKKQVSEMEKYLGDNGLVWKGYEETKGSDNQAIEKLKKDLELFQKPKYRYQVPKEIDINLILKKIHELNQSLKKEGHKGVFKDKRDGIHKFQNENDELVMGFYSDGIVISEYPFYSYGSNEGMQILTDILDGFFPYLIRYKFPHGIFLKVLDKTDQKYTSDKNKQIQSLDDVDENRLKPISKEEFLEKLPKQVIKNDQIINVRDEIAKKFDGKNIYSQEKQDVINQAFKHRIDENNFIIPLTEEQILFDSGKLNEEQIQKLCVIKIRSESGRNQIILKLNCNKLIKDVYEIVKGFSESKSFEFFDQIERKVIQVTESQNLEELELFPNSVLNLRQKQ